MTADELRVHLEKMAVDTVILPAEELVADHAVSCVDGRKDGYIVGAPGGNAGLFLLMLSAYERFAKSQLKEEDVEKIFEAYLSRFGPFYMHTDDIALNSVTAAWTEHKGITPSSDGTPTAEQVESWIYRPPDEVRDDLLRILLRPASMGCGHLRLMLEYPDEYGVRPELARSVLTLFFTFLWEGDDRLLLDILEGVHEEKAVVRVHVDPNDVDESVVVLVRPRFSDRDLFVFHPDAAAAWGQEHAVLLTQVGLLDRRETTAFAWMQHALGLDQLHETLRHLAQGLPVFDATFRIDGSQVVCANVSLSG